MQYQYRYLRMTGNKSPAGRLLLNRHPEFGSFMYDSDTGTNMPVLFHELAHCIELVDRGQIHRLKLDNFGWPIGEVGYFNFSSATSECKVFAIQYLLEIMFFGKVLGDDILSIRCASEFIQADIFWKNQDALQKWKDECNAFNRISKYMEYYEPCLILLLDTTIKYIARECN